MNKTPSRFERFLLDSAPIYDRRIMSQLRGKLKFKCKIEHGVIKPSFSEFMRFFPNTSKRLNANRK